VSAAAHRRSAMLKVFSRKGKDKSVKLPDVDEDGPAATPKSTVPDPMEQGAAKQAQLEAAARSGSSRAFAKYGAAKMTAQEQPEEITKLGSVKMGTHLEKLARGESMHGRKKAESMAGAAPPPEDMPPPPASDAPLIPNLGIKASLSMGADFMADKLAALGASLSGRLSTQSVENDDEWDESSHKPEAAPHSTAVLPGSG